MKATVLFIIKKGNGNILNFSQVTVRVLKFSLVLMQYQCKMTQHDILNVKLTIL